jgi:hypothetical protein
VFPLGHLAFAYLCFVAVVALTRRPLPAAWPLVPLAVGSQLPDLIDKPLAYYGVIVSGRSAAHSLLAAGVCIALITVVASGVRRRTPTDGVLGRLGAVTPAAFAVGYLSHLAGDSVRPVLAGNYGDVGFLLWPLIEVPRYAGDNVAPWIRLLEMYMQPLTHPDIPVIVAAAVVFVALRVRAATAADTPSTDRTDS